MDMENIFMMMIHIIQVNGKNDLKHGKGTMYDSNGNIQKKGKWVDDLFIAY